MNDSSIYTGPAAKRSAEARPHWRAEDRSAFYPEFEEDEFSVPVERAYGPYRVLGELGTGGMGTVYRALDTRLERQVAVKVLHRNADVSVPRERFLREARLVSSLNHPNICTIFDIGDEDGDPYLVMELLQGESLKDRMMRGVIPAEDIHEIAFRVASALLAAHAKGIVHRDVKPANIFLVHDGSGTMNVKVLDFGLAKLEADHRGLSDNGLTRTGATVGTVEYMSPEQACGEPLDARSDLFSLGAVLYEMATGIVPFHGATSAIIFSELLNRDPVPPREKNLQVSPRLDRIIRCLLIKDRERRMQTASALLDALSEESTEYDGPTGRSFAEMPKAFPTAIPLPGRPRGLIPFHQGKSSRWEAMDESRTPAGRASSSPFGNRRSQLTPPTGRRTPQPGNARSAKSFPRRAAPLVTDEVEDHRTGVFRAADAVAPPDADQFASRQVPAFAQQESVSAGWKVALTAGVVVVVLTTLLLLLLLARRDSSAGAWNGSLQVTPLLNETGDALLDQAPTVGLELLLAESAHVRVETTAATPRGQRNKGAVLSGSLSHTAEGYVLAVRVVDTSSKTVLSEAQDSVASLAEIPGLLSRTASRLRMDLGEPLDSVSGNSPVLQEEGSAVMAALESFGQAEEQRIGGNASAAATAYRQALHADPEFQVAEIRLATVLQSLHAKEEAAAVLQTLERQPAKGGTHLRQERMLALGGKGMPAEMSATAVAAE